MELREREEDEDEPQVRRRRFVERFTIVFESLSFRGLVTRRRWPRRRELTF